MPNRPPTYRPKHQQQAKKAAKVKDRKLYDHQRGSACKRGYDRRWRTYRLWFLRDHPFCSVEGCRKPATDVDHKIPVSGPDDEGFWDDDNHQALCHEHHAIKTRDDTRNGLTKNLSPPGGV